MRQPPPWASEVLASPQQDLLVNILVRNSDEATAELFRVHLLHAYARVKHRSADSIDDPLLRLMVRLSDESAYSLGTDNGTWFALFAMLREESPEVFAMWVNQHRDDFWLEPEFRPMAAWAYEDARGEIVVRFPGLDDAVMNAAQETKRLASQKGFAPSSSGGKEAGCYIATAVYGSYDAAPVLTLRRYRDERLSKTAAGRFVIRSYYAVSPGLVRRFGHVGALRRAVKFSLDGIVGHLESSGNRVKGPQ